MSVNKVVDSEPVASTEQFSGIAVAGARLAKMHVKASWDTQPEADSTLAILPQFTPEGEEVYATYDGDTVDEFELASAVEEDSVWISRTVIRILEQEYTDLIALYITNNGGAMNSMTLDVWTESL